MTDPQTLPEWEAYVSGLAGENLRSQAINVNTQQFASTLREEGSTMDEVREIVLYFARQLVATGQMVPEGGAFDMPMMARTDSIARQGPTMSEKDADALAQTTWDQGEDDIDRALDEAALE